MKRIKKYLFLLLTAILLFAQPMPQVQAFTTTAATGQVKLNKKSLTIAYTKTAKLKLKGCLVFKQHKDCILRCRNRRSPFRRQSKDHCKMQRYILYLYRHGYFRRKCRFN